MFIALNLFHDYYYITTSDTKQMSLIKLYNLHPFHVHRGLQPLSSTVGALASPVAGRRPPAPPESPRPPRRHLGLSKPASLYVYTTPLYIP